MISRKATKSLDGILRKTVTVEFRFTEKELQDFKSWCEENGNSVESFLRQSAMQAYYNKENTEEGGYYVIAPRKD